jgi:hypothetical protein
VQIFFSGEGNADDFVRTRKTSRVLVRRSSTNDPFADEDEFVLEEGGAGLIFETDEGQVIELHPDSDEFDDDTRAIKREKRKFRTPSALPELEEELRDELARAQGQIRRSEQQAQAMLKEHLARMQDQEQLQRRVMKESMKKQQEQLQLMLKKMERQMETLSRENARMRKQLQITDDAFGGRETN